MTLILDSGGISALAGNRARLAELRRRDLWPPEVPSVTLVEALTGDHRRDFEANRLLRTCLVVDVDEATCREAARIRTASGRAATISAVDAIVVVVAESRPDPIVLTSDPDDMSSLIAQSAGAIVVVAT
jgi:predicted nucleic acid-binding protein